MNVIWMFSSPFKGEAGRGMGWIKRMFCATFTHPHPNPPLEGEGALIRLP